jgi:uncharacterized membrane protein (DUF4010 family)
LNWDLDYRNLAISLAAGLLVGIQRGWRQRDEVPGSRVAGVRTFALLGLLGGVSGLLLLHLHPIVPAVILAGAVVVLVMAYRRSISGPNDVSATNLIVALLTLCFGLLATTGRPALAMAAAAVTTLVLALRTELHGLMAKLDEADVKALARFAIIAGAILPFVPNAQFGPYDAWNPRQLWMVVVLVTGFSFAGYAANRIFGERHGTLATAIIGGAYSSTAVTTVLSHRLREERGARKMLSAAIAMATAVMFARVLILTGILAPFAFFATLIVVGPATLIAIVAGLLLLRQEPKSDGNGAAPPSNPIALIPALGFLILVAVMAVAARWAGGAFGGLGKSAVIVAIGGFDVDAAIITVSGLRSGELSNDIAGLVLSLAVFINMLVKIGVVALYAGLTKGRLAIVALAASAAALLLAAVLRASALAIF